MTIENLKKENNVVELEIAIGAEEFEKAVEAAYQKNKGKVNVPGFRKGKAPRKMIEKMYGTGFFYEDAINDLYPKAYEEAVKESAIVPVDRADIEVLSVDENGFKFKATVTVKPEVSIKDYKGITAEKPAVKVTDKDVDAEIERYQQRQSRLVDVTDRPTELGDTVIFDFEGFVDGKAFDGGKAEGYGLKLGSGQFIPGFEDQMVGKNAEEEFSVNVTFPEEYHEESLKGKPAEFKIKLHEIKKEELPAVDDEFVKDISEFETLAEFKADILAKLTQQREDAAEGEVAEQISRKLADLLEADIPACMIENEIDQNLSDFDRRLQYQGANLQKYCEITGQDINSIRAMFKDNAEYNVKLRLALEKIAELESVVVSEEEVDEEYKKFAEQMRTEVDKIKNDYVTEQLIKDLTVQKAFEFVKANATVTAEKKKAAPKKKKVAEATEEKPAEEAEKKPAAKKTTAKKTTAKTAAAKDGEAPAKKPAAKKTAAKKSEPKAE